MSRASRNKGRTPSARFVLPDAEATEALGAALWQAWHGEQCVLMLEGDLGAGKTTLVRGLLRGAGYGGSVRSPTYTLMEPYDIGGRRVLHLDLYRVGDPEELEFLGLRDELGCGRLILVEWPSRGHGALPHEDLRLQFTDHGGGRLARIEACTDSGRVLLAAVAQSSVLSN